MLPPNYLENIEKQAMNVYNNLELDIIQEIAERIANVGYANTVVKNDIMIAQEMGMLYTDVVDLVAKYNKSSYEDTLKIFEDAGATSIKIDDEVYKKAGLNPIKIKQDKSMMDLLIASAEKTNNNLNNLVMTTASTSQLDFLNAMNQAYMEVSTGVKSYSQSIIDVVDKISKKGTTVEYPSGHKTSIESAARMNIVTGVNQTCGKLQEMRALELGWDLMEITAHGGARPEHAEWQGKIVSLSGQKGYLSLKDIGYGTATGFKGVNCRHDWMPYFKGSSRTYTEEQLRKWQNETVEYNGTSMTRYQSSQTQRQMEKVIREDKKKLIGYDGILRSNTTDTKLIEDTKMAFSKQSLIYNQHQKQLNDFVKQIESKKDETRMYVGNYERTISKQVQSVKGIANKYNKEVIGSKVNGIEIKEIGEHIISRTYMREISIDDVQDTLKNPIKYGKIRKDKSQQIKGANCTVVVNTETGKMITVYGKKTEKEG